MKRLGFLPFLVLLALASPAAAEVRLDLKTVVHRVAFRNYTVLQNAFTVYQAKEKIQFSRGDLLPRLNVWKVLGIAVDPIGNGITTVEDIAPFLVPANWFRLDQAQKQYRAQKEGYRALWANELMNAKALYCKVLADTELYNAITQAGADLEPMLDVARTRESFGKAKPGAARDIEVRLLALQEDKRALESLLRDERAQLAYAVGLPVESELLLEPLPVLDMDRLPKLDFEDFRFRALDTAPEMRQFQYFLEIADSVSDEIRYSLLGVSSITRGAGGGAFDGVPIQNGLGFGMGPSLNINRAQKRILELQRHAVGETILRQLKLTVDGNNLDRENLVNLHRRVDLTRQTFDQLQERVHLGAVIDIFEIIEASRNEVQAVAAMIPVKYRFYLHRDRLNRLLFQGDYRLPPAAIDTVKGRL